MLVARGAFRRANLVLAVSLIGVLGVLALAGCGSDNKNPVNPPGGSTSSFTGTFGGGRESGKLTMTINTTSLAGRGFAKRAPRGIVTATGTATLNGSSTNLTGSYDTASNTFGLAGGGYSFAGVYEPSTFSRPNVNGFWTSPTDTGEFICYLGNSSNVHVFGGMFHSTASPPDSGSWSFVVVDTTLAGVAHGDGSAAGVYFAGKMAATGNPRAITINYATAGYTLFAPGTFDTTGIDSVRGTYILTDLAGAGAGNDNGTYGGVPRP